MADEPMRLALVGCGWISAAHVQGYKAMVEAGCRDYTFAAVCDTSRAAAEARASEIEAIQGTRPRILGDVEAVIAASDLEGAVGCLPHYLHHTVGGALLEGGKHLLLEKPLGITIRASRRLIETAAKAGRVLATAENTRRTLGSRACRWALMEKKMIGEVQGVHVHHTAHGPFDVNDPKFQWRLLKKLVGGGMIMDSGAHFADMMLHLFGDVAEVQCFIRTLDGRMIENAPRLGTVPADVEDTWHATLRFATGLHATWTYARSTPCERRVFGTYLGTEGSLEDRGFPFHCFEGGGEIVTSADKRIPYETILQEYLLQLDPGEKARLFPCGCTHSFGIEQWDFVDAIRSGRAPEIDGEGGLRAKTLCECCYESATAGHAVAYTDVLNGTVDAYQRPIDAFWELDKAAPQLAAANA